MKTITAYSVIVLTSILFSMPAPAAQNYGAGDSRVVLSKSGLNIREKADMRAKVLGLAPCGALVMMEEGPSGAAQVIEGIAGGWAKVTYRDITGYAFNGFLSRLRAPEQGCASLEEYFNDQFKSAGSPVEKVDTGEGTEEKITDISFSNGATIRHKDVTYLSDNPNWSVSTYTLPGIERVEEVFLIMKLLDYIEPGFAFPVKSGRAGFTKNGSAIEVMITRKNNECQYLALIFRRPDFSGKKTFDNTAPKIVFSREAAGIVIEMYNMKR